MLTVRVTDHEGNTRSAGQAYDQAQQKKQELQQQKEETKGDAKSQLKSHAQDLNNSRDPNASLSEQKDQLAGRADEKRSAAESETNRNAPSQDQARNKAEELKQRIPEEHREKVDNAVQETKEFFQEAFPEERREQFIYRLKKVVVECQQHKDYQEAMEWLLQFFSSKSNHRMLLCYH